MLANASNGKGTLNLNGTTGSRGVLETTGISEGTGTVGGAIKFNGGILRATANSSDFLQNFETGDMQILSGGAFIDTQGFNVAIALALQGSGGLNKQGAGKLTLSGNSTYSGDTTVEAGTLEVTGSLSGAVTVQSGGLLSGTGTLRAATLQSGGRITPGVGGIGTLHTQDETWNGGGTYLWDINAPAGTPGTNWDFIDAAGALNIAATSGNKFTLGINGSVSGLTFYTDYDWTILTASSGFGGTFDASKFAFDTTGFTSNTGGAFSVLTSGNNLVLRYSAAPEPGGAVLLLLGATLLATRRRRGPAAPPALGGGGENRPSAGELSKGVGPPAVVGFIARCKSLSVHSVNDFLPRSPEVWVLPGVRTAFSPNRRTSQASLVGEPRPCVTTRTNNFPAVHPNWHDMSSCLRRSRSQWRCTRLGRERPLRLMKRSRNALVAVLAVVVVAINLASSARAQGPQYVVSDLGTLGGSTSVGYGINNAGQVAGSSDTTGNSTTHAALFSAGNSPVDLGTLGGSNSIGWGINNTGQIVGQSITSGGVTHAFLYSGGSMSDLGTLGGSNSIGYGINNTGQITGQASTSGGFSHAFLYAGGNKTDLGTLGGSFSIGFGINNAGQMTGEAAPSGGSFHAFLYSGGSMTDLGTLGGSGSASAGYAINNAGQVAGFTNTSNSARAFLYSGGSMTELGSLNNGSSFAYGINSAGQVTGYSTSLAGDHAFLYSAGTMYDLNNLISGVQGVTSITESSGGNHLNDRGQISAQGTVGGQTHAVLLTPRAMGTAFSGGLGEMPGGTYNSVALGIANGGTVVAGGSITANNSNGSAFSWTLSGGMKELNAAVSPLGGDARAVTPDGRYLVGQGLNGANSGAFRYDNQSSTYLQLGFLPGYTFSSRANGVSDDGSVAAGFSQTSAGARQAFRWTQAGGVSALGWLPGGSADSLALGVSGNGQVIVGRSDSTASVGNLEAFRWTQAGGMVGLGDLAGGVFSSTARAASTDGSVIVGRGTSAAGLEAFRWTPAGGMVSLGDLAGGAVGSDANGVSGNGQIVVGSGTDAVGTKAMVWDAKNGMRNLQTVLSSEYGVDFTGWTLNGANAISSNGDAVAGQGTDPLGNAQAWSAQINSRTYRFVSGELYGTPASPFHTSKLGGLGTAMDILGGTAGGTAGPFKTVTVNLLAMPIVQFLPGFASDVIDLSGTGGDRIVLRLGYDEATAIALYGSESKVWLGWFDPNTNQWENAVQGDTGGTANFVGDRAYNPATDFVLGDWGIDTANNQVWAVINHNSQFAVVPEPGSVGLLLFGLGALAARRRR